MESGAAVRMFYHAMRELIMHYTICIKHNELCILCRFDLNSLHLWQLLGLILLLSLLLQTVINQKLLLDKRTDESTSECSSNEKCILKYHDLDHIALPQPLSHIVVDAASAPPLPQCGDNLQLERLSCKRSDIILGALICFFFLTFHLSKWCS